MVEILSVGLGFSLTTVFIFSLGFLYFLDYRFRNNGQNHLFYISLGALSLLILLIALIMLGKTIIYNTFLYSHKDTAFRFLTVGIIFGLITFPFVLRNSTKVFLRL